MEIFDLSTFLVNVQIEQKFTLAGLGTHQVTLHCFSSGQIWLTAWRFGKLVKFSEAKWLQGHVRLSHAATGNFKSRRVDGELIALMIDSSYADALVAMRKRDLYLLSQAIISAYVLQQILGTNPLPNRGELGKRYSNDVALYLFEKKITALERKMACDWSAIL